MSNPNTADAPKKSTYDPDLIEGKWYQYWEENGFFKSNAAS